MDIQTIKDLVKLDQEAWLDVYNKAAEDLYFLSDAEDAQWDSKDLDARKNRQAPSLTIDQLSQFVHQVVNDIRMNTPDINVIPSDGAANKDTAEVFQGMIRNIEYRSGADTVYDTAALFSVKCGIGFMRVDHDYVSEEGFEQELLIKRNINPLGVFIDKSSVEVDGSDAKRAAIMDNITVKEFKERFPDKEPVSFETDKPSMKDSDIIQICEFFCVKEESKWITFNEDGSLGEVESTYNGKKRKVTKRKVLRYLLSGADILEETTFPSKYIPVVPVYGEETWVNGVRNPLSLIRKSKGAQKLYNIMRSLECELLLKQPRATFIAAEGQVEDFADDYKDPSKVAVIRYRQQDAAGNQAAPPQQVMPPQIPAGLVNAARESVEDIKATMGMYNASIGNRSNETSGVAIAQRQQEGDVATFHFGDNLVKSIQHIGRILVDAIPKIYDTPRVLRIIGEEGEHKSIGVNGEVGEDGVSYDLSNGSFDVRVTTGASYTTRRQEAVAALQDLFKADPNLMPIMGDLYFENSDFAGAKQMAARYKKVIDPKFLEDDTQDPQVAQLQQGIQELQAALQVAQQELQSKQGETALKAQENAQKLEIERMKLQLQAQESMSENEYRAAELDLKAKELAIKEQELLMKRELAAQELEVQRLQMLVGEQPEMPEPEDDKESEALNMIAETQAFVAQNTNEALKFLAQAQNENTQILANAMNKPKNVVVKRDATGRMVGAEVESENDD